MRFPRYRSDRKGGKQHRNAILVQGSQALRGSKMPPYWFVDTPIPLARSRAKAFLRLFIFFVRLSLRLCLSLRLLSIRRGRLDRRVIFSRQCG